MVATLNKPTVGEFESARKPTVSEFELPIAKREYPAMPDFAPYDPSQPFTPGAVKSPYGTFIEAYGDIAHSLGIPFERLSKAIVAPIAKLGLAITPDIKKQMIKGMVEQQATANTIGLSKEAKQKEIERLNLLFPELKEKVVRPEAKEIPATFKNAMKALVPLPGMTKDTESVAEIASKYYKEMTGEKPPFWYGNAMEFASTIVAMEGVRATARFVAGFAKWAKGKPQVQIRPARAEVDVAWANYQKTGDRTQWDAVRVKYAGIKPEGVSKIRARAKPPTVKDFGEYPIARPIEAPPTVPIKAPSEAVAGRKVPKAPITPAKAERVEVAPLVVEQTALGVSINLDEGRLGSIQITKNPIMEMDKSGKAYKTTPNSYDMYIIVGEGRRKGVGTRLFMAGLQHISEQGGVFETHTDKITSFGKPFLSSLKSKGLIDFDEKILKSGGVIQIKPAIQPRTTPEAPITPKKIKPEQITRNTLGTIDVDLPPIKEGYIRLYRGQHPTKHKDLFHPKRGILTDKEIQELGLSQGKGGWFTPWVNYAVNYAEAQGEGWEIAYIDVLRTVADKHIAIEAPKGLAEAGEAMEYYFPELREAPITPAKAEPAKTEKPIPSPAEGVKKSVFEKEAEPTKVEKAEEITLNRANLPDKATYKGLNEQIAIAKYTEKRKKYKPEADFEKEFRSMSKAEQKRQIKDYRPGQALDAETWLKRFARIEPEFAANPVFTVKDGMLVFKDGFKYRIEPRWLGLDKAKLKEGQQVRVDLVDLSQPKKKLKAEPVKPKGKPGFIDVRPLLKVHKTFMGIVEPSKAVELKLGKEAYATVIKGVHEVDVGRIEFNEAQIEGQDKSLGQLSEWFNKFSDKDLKNFMISRGQPTTEGARLIQRDAMGKLAKELRRGDLFQAVQRIADSNYKYLQSVVGDDIHRVEDYFYGIYKNPKQVDKFLDYWRTTKRFTKEKKLPTVADAIDYGLELRNYNPIENLKAEYIAISHLKGMNWMRDELLRTGKGKFIDETAEAPLEWDMVQDPVFKDLRLQPDLAKLINNLIATNKITRIPLANTLREINNVARTVKFIGSAFHLLSVAKQSIADSGYLGFLYKPTATRGFTRGFRTNDPIFRTTAYKDYVRHGGGHRYSVESEARRTFNRAVNELNRNMGTAVKVGALPLKIPTGFVNWMFQSYIPKVKYSKFLDVVAEQEKKLGRVLTSPEKIDIIKEQQNFYGMMNERLFGRSGTVTSAMRFYFMSPGYAEGNYRSMLKAATQWGGKTGAKANRSRSNIINSWLITATAATVGTLIFTGKPPEKPELLDDARDLFKIDTGKKDEKGRKIMIDLMTYDKDYWNVAFNILRLRPDVAIGKSWRRIGGMKAPMADIIDDLVGMSMGKAIMDWKEDRVIEITDPFLLKVMKLTKHEVEKLVPISVSVFQQSKKRDIDTTVAAVETLLGFRPGKTEKDAREQKIISKMHSLAGQREELTYYIGNSTDPKRTVEIYNKTVNSILNSPYIPKSMKDEWGPKLLVDYDKVVTWKRFPAGKMTDPELRRAYDAHTLSVPYKRRGEPFRQIGAPKKGSERRISELKAEAQKRGIELKRGPRKPPRR